MAMFNSYFYITRGYLSGKDLICFFFRWSEKAKGSDSGQTSVHRADVLVVEIVESIKKKWCENQGAWISVWINMANHILTSQKLTIMDVLLGWCSSWHHFRWWLFRPISMIQPNMIQYYVYNVGKTIINHPQFHHSYRWYVYHSQFMGGLWHCFNHITHMLHVWYIYLHNWMIKYSIHGAFGLH